MNSWKFNCIEKQQRDFYFMIRQPGALTALMEFVEGPESVDIKQ
jgi:hypothetical protein